MATADPFAQTLTAVSGIEGWMTDQQARRLWDRAGELQAGDQIVEIGSFRGRSVIVLARSAAPGVAITAIDPHAGNDRGPHEFEGFDEAARADAAAFAANLDAAGVADRVRHVPKFSHAALGDVQGDIRLLYIDGAHRYRPALADIRDWGRRVAPGGTMLIHDSFSALGVTLALMRLLFFGRRFRYIGRSGTMTEYRREPVQGAARLANGARQAIHLPYFVRNELVKALLLLHLRPLTRLLGLPKGRDWPH
jgi:hypothetical protein